MNRFIFLIMIVFLCMMGLVEGVAPVMDNSSISPSPAYVTDTLVGSCNATDGDGDDLIYYYQWYLDGVANESGSYTRDYCYQESANVSTTCGGFNTGTYSLSPNYLYINYVKPPYAINTSLWQVKHGWNITTPYTENITLPQNCWIQSPLKLRIYSKDTLGLSETQPQCYNGTTWENIGSNRQHLTGGVCLPGSDNLEANLYDGVWNTWARYDLFPTWCGSGSIDGSEIYEEAMWWDSVNSDVTLTTSVVKDQNWTYSCSVGDGTTNSSWLNSSQLTISNTAPSSPTLVFPTPTGVEEIQIDPTLQVSVSDADSDTLNVSFYHSNGTLIGSSSVAGSGTASYQADLSIDTIYNWYVVVNDTSGSAVTSSTWQFRTVKEGGSSPSPPPPTQPDDEVKGGGSEPDPTSKKIDCNMVVNPSIVMLTLEEKLIEVTIKNKEDFSYTPSFQFVEVEDKESALDVVQLASEIGTIFPGSTKSFGISFLNGNIEETLYAELRLNDFKCHDIIIPIEVRQSKTAFDSIFVAGELSFDKIIDSTKQPIIKNMPLFKIWQLMIFFALVTLFLITRKGNTLGDPWSDSLITNFIVKAIGWALLTGVFTIVSVLLIKLIERLLS